MAKAVSLFALPDETVGEVVELIAENLRPADLAEIAAHLGEPPLEVLRASVAASTHAWVILDRRGLPIGLFGAAPALVAGVGVPWMVGTSGITREFVAVARQTARYVEELHEAYPTLTNFIDARNDDAIDWLLRSGFHLIDAAPRFGVERRPFLQFSRTR